MWQHLNSDGDYFPPSSLSSAPPPPPVECIHKGSNLLVMSSQTLLEILQFTAHILIKHEGLDTLPRTTPDPYNTSNKW